ncbi:MAG: transcription factor [Zestosphaera sp.]
MSKVGKMEKLARFIEEYVGESGKVVFEVLVKRSKELTDADIITETGLGDQEVRRILYELHSLGIVAYKRRQSPEDGRFIYHWFIDAGRLNQVHLQRKREVLGKLRTRLDYERSHTFFTCDNDGVRLTFDEAYENDFKCPKCGSELRAEDNAVVKDYLENTISRLEEEILNEEKEITG